jgi:hypothetical protein
VGAMSSPIQGCTQPELSQLHLEFAAGVRRSASAAGRREAQSRTMGAGRAHVRGARSVAQGDETRSRAPRSRRADNTYTAQMS